MTRRQKLLVSLLFLFVFVVSLSFRLDAKKICLNSYKARMYVEETGTCYQKRRMVYTIRYKVVDPVRDGYLVAVIRSLDFIYD